MGHNSFCSCLSLKAFVVCGQKIPAMMPNKQTNIITNVINKIHLNLKASNSYKMQIEKF